MLDAPTLTALGAIVVTVAGLAANYLQLRYKASTKNVERIEQSAEALAKRLTEVEAAELKCRIENAEHKVKIAALEAEDKVNKAQIAKTESKLTSLMSTKPG